MNPNDPYEQNTVLEQYSQFPSDPNQDAQNQFQFSQNGLYPSSQPSSFQYNRRYGSESGMPYGSYDPQFPFLQYSLLQQQSQGPQDRLWQWYLGRNTRQKLIIGCGILISLLLLGTIFGAIASAEIGSQQPQTTTMQIARKAATNHVSITSPQPTSTTNPVSTLTPEAMLIPNFPAVVTPPPSPTPTFAPSPTSTPEPVEKVNVTVTSQIVKKVGTVYRYIFNILNSDNKSFGGSVTISLYNDQQQTPLGQQTFNMATQPLQSGLASLVYFDNSTGPISQQSGSGITRFMYTIIVNGQQANTGEGQITNNYEDTALF